MARRSKDQNGLHSEEGSLELSEQDRARLAIGTGKEKLDIIMASRDPVAFVRALPAEDLFFAIQDIGPHDSAELVAMATPEQFQTFLDLDVWQGYLPSPDRILSWLELVNEGASQPEDLRRQRRGMDPELILLVLKDKTSVHSLEENEDPILTSDNWLRSAEGKYVVEIHATGDEGAILRRLIDDFMDESPFEATRLFEAVRWEQRSELEETALRWRNGRMRDIGFPELEEAIQIWAPLPASWKPRESAADFGPVSGAPGILLAGSKDELFLDRVLSGLGEDNRPQVNEKLIFLLNCALVADQTSPTDLDLAQNTLRSTRDLLSLGLELLSEGSEERGQSLLEANTAIDIFRYAVTRVRKLAQKATPAAEALRFGTGSLIALDSPESELLSGLLRRRPRFFDPRDVKQSKTRPSSGLRAPRTPADLEVLEHAIGLARLLGAMLAQLQVDKESFLDIASQAGRTASSLSANQLVLAAAIRALLAKQNGKTLAVSELAAPLSVEQLESFAKRLEDGQVSSSDHQELEAIFKQLAADSSPEDQAKIPFFTARSVALLESEVGAPAQKGSLDPRFVECVPIQSDDATEQLLEEDEEAQDGEGED